MMSRFFVGIAAVVTLAMILACGTPIPRGTGPGNNGEGQDSPGPDPDELSEKVKIAVTISAKELVAKYKEQTTADAAFKDKWVIVDGEVEEVATNGRFVTFNVRRTDFYVQCFFDKAWDGELGKLASGKPAKICGQCTGRTESNVAVKNCFFPEAIPALAQIKKKREEDARKADEEARAEAARKAEEEYEANGLVLLLKTVKGTRGQFGGEITGTVVNRRPNKLNYAQIQFNLYDGTGAQVGTALANINGLEPGGRWNFTATTFGKDFATYKFSELSGF
jgi:hypothetical protein